MYVQNMWWSTPCTHTLWYRSMEWSRTMGYSGLVGPVDIQSLGEFSWVLIAAIISIFCQSYFLAYCMFYTQVAVFISINLIAQTPYGIGYSLVFVKNLPVWSVEGLINQNMVFLTLLTRPGVLWCDPGICRPTPVSEPPNNPKLKQLFTLWFNSESSLFTRGAPISNQYISDAGYKPRM